MVCGQDLDTDADFTAGIDSTRAWIAARSTRASCCPIGAFATASTRTELIVWLPRTETSRTVTTEEKNTSQMPPTTTASTRAAYRNGRRRRSRWDQRRRAKLRPASVTVSSSVSVIGVLRLLGLEQGEHRGAEQGDVTRAEGQHHV